MPTLALPKNKLMQAATKAALATFAALLLSLFVITTTGCKKPTDNPPTGNNTPTPTPCDTCLPPITTHGAGTFGCKINGKPFVAKGRTMFPATQLDVKEFYVGIMGSDYSIVGNPSGISFGIDPVLDTCELIFPNLNLTFSAINYTNNFINYSSKPIKKGIIKFNRVDYNKMVFSGTFEFDIYSIDGKDTIHITEGRFDLHH